MQRSTVVSRGPHRTATAGWAPQVRADQIAALYRNLPTNLPGATVVATLVAVMLYGTVSSWILAGWLLAVLGVAVLQFTLRRQFNAARPDTPVIGPWGRRIILTTAAAGMLWGLGGVLLHSPEILADQLFLLIVEIIIALASTCRTAMLLPAFFGFVYPILLLSAAPFLFAKDPLRLGIGVATLLLLPILTQMALRDWRAFAHSARLRMQNESLMEELRRQKLAAESAQEAKSRFLAVANHDLRQPLHALALFVETLQDSSLAARERHVVSNIRRSVDALRKLFDDLLDASRFDAGAGDPQLEALELVRGAPLDLAGLPVLLVDVSARSRAALEPWLLHWNCEVAAAGSGAGVHRMLRSCQRAPALIIAQCHSRAPSDAFGPNSNAHAADPAARVGNDGMAPCLDLVELLRAEFNVELPAVLLTDESGVDRIWSSESGRLAVLHEPFNSARLGILITDLLHWDRRPEASRRVG